MLKIAITGGAGSGKSTVARMFAALGAEVLDADQMARDAVAVGRPAWQELRRRYGEDFFHPDGTLNRTRLAQKIFADPEERRFVNGVVHPEIAREIKRRLADLESHGVDLVLVEVPLLFEAGLEKSYDRVIVVYVDEAGQMQRLRDRDRRGETEIRGLLRAQWPLADKVGRADFVIDNGGDLTHTRGQVKHIWRELKKSLTGGIKKVSVPRNLP